MNKSHYHKIKTKDKKIEQIEKTQKHEKGLLPNKKTHTANSGWGAYDWFESNISI